MRKRLALVVLSLSGLGLGCGGSTAATCAVDAADAGADGSASPDGSPDVSVVVGRSAGCGVPPDQALAQFVQHTEVVTNVAPAYVDTATNRTYWLRLPHAYDPDRAYPLVLIGPGCGESGMSSIPLNHASGDDAILVGMNGVDNCFNHDAADTPDLPYFDTTLAAVEAATCVDTSRVFVMGYSSGAWLSNLVGCARGDVVRAQATVAGGLPPLPPTCTGPIPAMIVADTVDPSATNVPAALARVLAANGCGTDTVPYDIGVPSPCVQYQGCAPGSPVVFCETTGLGHIDQASTGISTTGFWHFFSSLPARPSR